MAQFTEIEIDIDGRIIKQFSSFSLSQGIFTHHAFRLVCPATAIDGETGAIFNASKNLMGGGFKLKISSIGSSGVLQFSGVVTQVEAARHSGHAGDIIICGYSPTILMDNAPHCKSWEGKAVKGIAQDVLKHFQSNLLQPKVNPVYGEVLDYTVQYKESAWQFLHRLGATFGEWLFYDGKNLVLGQPQGTKANLLYGSNLSQFNMALQLRPTGFQMMGYDYTNSAVYGGSPQGIAGKAGLNDLGRHALQKSEKFYTTKPKQWHNHNLTNKKQLDDFVDARASMQSSSMVRFNGNSGHPGVQVGGTVSVSGKNVFSESDESFGDYIVTSVNHYCDGQGNYNNDFIAVPAGIKMPPIAVTRETHCETQSALVTDNHDPKGLGRVRVKFHWMNGSEKSPWIRVTSPHAGSDKGGFFMPEKGEEVIVGFEGDSPEKPYVVGTVYHGKAKTGFANAENDLKVIQTRSGHVMEYDDKKGAEKITLRDISKNSITLDTAGEHITIKDKAENKITLDSAHKSITITDKNNNSIKIETNGNKITIKDKNKNNVTIDAGDNSIGIKALGTITLAAMNINLVAGATINVQATAAYNLNTMNCMTNVSKNTLLRTKDLTNTVANLFSVSATTINHTAKKDINTKAKEKIIVSAKKKLDQRAGEMDVSTSKGKLRLNSSSDTEIKGKTVKTN